MPTLWCLPRAQTSEFLKALVDGRLNPAELMDMTSQARHRAFAEVVGADHAREVNAQFESKMLLKDQKQGFITWARNVAGLSEPVRRDILKTVAGLTKALTPDEEERFLGDLASKKLGVAVGEVEAKKIVGLAEKAQSLLNEITTAGAGDYRTGALTLGKEAYTQYGLARLDLHDYIESLKPGNDSIYNKIGQAIAFPKSALTSIFHWSAPLVQGYGMISQKVWWTGLREMWDYFRSEDAYRQLEGYILGHPDYPLAVKAKLGLTDVNDQLTAREEAIQSNLIEQMNQWVSDKTNIPNVILAWSRSFTGFLNYVRFNRYTQLLDAARLRGEDVSMNSRVITDIADAVNNFTGRGNLGKDDRHAHVGPFLNTFFFAPRKMVATMEMFNPWRMLDPKVSPTARRAVISQLFGSLLATGAVLTLAKLAGGNVNMDPRSQDFARFDIGGEKFDMTGGSASYARLLGRMITNQEVTGYGEVRELGQGYAPSRAELLQTFIRGKMSPLMATIFDGLYGSDTAGHAFSVPREMMNMLVPIVLDSEVKLLANNPGDFAAYGPALLAFLGMGMDSPEAPASQQGMNIWGQPSSMFNNIGFNSPPSWRNDPVTQEVTRLDLAHFPAPKIRGQNLTDEQYAMYIRNSGQIAYQSIQQLMQEPWWDRAPDEMKRRLMMGQIMRARHFASMMVMGMALGSQNDIATNAAKEKEAEAAVIMGTGLAPEEIGKTKTDQGEARGP